MDELIKQARDLRLQERAYEREYYRFKMSLKPMDEANFWCIAEVLGKYIAAEPSRPVESQIHNLMCTFIHGTLRPSAAKDLEAWPEGETARWIEMIRFMVKFGEVSSKLSQKMHDMKGLDRGDDGYGDLMDSLPLAGRQVFVDIMEDEIATYKQLEKALAKSPLKDFILDGENYVQMYLGDKLRDQLPAIVATRDYQENGGEREPDFHVVLMPGVVPLDDKSHSFHGDVPVGLKLLVKGTFHDRETADAYVEQERGGIVVKLWPGVVKQ